MRSIEIPDNLYEAIVEIGKLILAERMKAFEGRKLPENRHPVDWLAILSEDFGQVAHEVCNINFDVSGANANVNRAIKSYKTKLAMLAADCINMIDDIGKWASDNGYES